MLAAEHWALGGCSSSSCPPFRRLGLLLRIGALSAIALLACPLGCGRAVPSAAAVAGCWAFERRDGRSDPLGAMMPDRVRLDSAPELNPDGAPNAVYPLRLQIASHRMGARGDTVRGDTTTNVEPRDWILYYDLAAWRFRAPDSVQILFYANMDLSWELSLESAGDSLFGYAQQSSDDAANSLRLPIVARRATCAVLTRPTA